MRIQLPTKTSAVFPSAISIEMKMTSPTKKQIIPKVSTQLETILPNKQFSSPVQGILKNKRQHKQAHKKEPSQQFPEYKTTHA